MSAKRSLLPAILLGALLAPAAGRAQSAQFERRPYVILNGGFAVQGSGETSTASGLGGPQANIGVAARVTRDAALSRAVAATHSLVGLGLGLWI